MEQQETSHIPVLRDEAVAALAIKTDGYYIDGTFGRGGHSSEILTKLGPAGRLLAVDQDPEAVAVAEQLFGQDARFEIVHSSFLDVSQLVSQNGAAGAIDGVLLDLGVSSPQLDQPERGFSFDKDGPLDMRMNPDAGMSAHDWLATVSVEDLMHVLRVYGEEKFARRIATAIVTSREEQPITRTKQLAQLVAAAMPRHEHHKHPATRTFQAIRIQVNNELDIIEKALGNFIDILKPGGRLAVIAFHSLEDRIVKTYFRKCVKAPPIPKGMPMAPTEFMPKLTLIGKAIKAGDEELKRNYRARSAILRVAEKR